MDCQVAIQAEWFFYFQDIETREEWTQGPFLNKVVQGGLENMAALLIGEVPSDSLRTNSQKGGIF